MRGARVSRLACAEEGGAKTKVKTLVIKHVAFEDLGAWAAPLAERGEVEIFEAGIGDFAALDFAAPDLLIVLGGPIGVYETDSYPFLIEEIAFVAKRLAAGRPVLGVCLGAQIMAAALGARVYPGPAREIGFLPITLSEAGAASPLAAFADAARALHWHGDTFDLPPGARLLASSDAVVNQAFALRPGQLAVQFHPEADLAAFERWLIGHAVELAAAGMDVCALRDAARAHAPDLAAKARRVLDAYLAESGL